MDVIDLGAGILRRVMVFQWCFVDWVVLPRCNRARENLILCTWAVGWIKRALLQGDDHLCIAHWTTS